MLWWLKAWAWLKKYWYIVVAVVGAILAFALLGKKDLDLTATIDAINKQHQAELDAINAANKKQQEDDAAAYAKLQSQLNAIQAQYDAAQKELTAEKKAEIEQILKDSNGDPNVLAQKLSEATGFNVILPTE